MYQKIDHLAIIVKDLDEALSLYRDTLGFEFTGVADFPQIGIKQAFFPVGESFFQLVAPSDPKGLVAKYLEENGEGMYLIAVSVDDLRATLDELKAKGATVVGKVTAGVITSSPGSKWPSNSLEQSVATARRLAEEPEFTNTASETPSKLPSSSSNSSA